MKFGLEITAVVEGGERQHLATFSLYIHPEANIPITIRKGTTPREHQVLEALRQGLINKEISNQLHISTRTVKFHISNLLRKYGVSSRWDLVKEIA